MTIKTLNIIGCGRAARTLARLWSDTGCVRVQQVLTRSEESAGAACAFIRAGQPVALLEAMQPAQLWLLGVPDGEIVPAATMLAESALPRDGDGVFHLSGFTASTALAGLQARGMRVASAHPVLSFADPAVAMTQFVGARVGLEGDTALCETLRGLFESVGGACFGIDADRKPLYHAGSVFASNFLVVLMDVALRAYREAGLDDDSARALLAPLARNALENVIANGPEASLTGPAARGDHAVVRAQHAAVKDWDGAAGEAYGVLTTLAFSLARRASGPEDENDVTVTTPPADE